MAGELLEGGRESRIFIALRLNGLVGVGGASFLLWWFGGGLGGE